MMRFWTATESRTAPILIRYAAVLVLATVVAMMALPNAGADEPKICLAGGNDGAACTADSQCPGGSCTANDVRAYATGCYARLGIKPADFAGPFQCKAPGAVQLTVKVDGVIKDINCPRNPADPNCPAGQKNPNAATDMPQTCDTPAWLPNPKGRCYGNSYVQQLKINDDVQGALLCRHKQLWSDGDTDFPDIAIILHNSKNGETCWFQTTDDTPCAARDPGVGCDGTKVPAPHTPEGKTFWLTPQRTAKINCVSCHDNGPFMNSRWMFDSGVGLRDDDFGKYLNNGYGFSTPINGIAWGSPKFVTVGRDGLADENAQACTECHKIHAAAQTPDPEPSFGRDYHTFSEWLDYTVGAKSPRGANATGQGFAIAYWMPRDHGEASADDWKKIYAAHVDKLRNCMNGGTRGAGCQDLKVAFNTSPSGPGGAWMYASVDGGQTFAYSSEATASHSVGAMYPVKPGSHLMLRWEADASINSCVVEATFPSDDIVSSTGVGTASNWSLPESEQDIGVLTYPGEYRFDLYCDGERSANLIFQVSRQEITGAPNCDCTNVDAGLLTGPYQDQCNAREQQLIDFAAAGNLKLQLGADGKIASGEFCDPVASGPQAWPVPGAAAEPPAGVPRGQPCTPHGLVQQCD
jgi:hypothetical protein